MDNFQLYRTNVLLGGQIKWDLIINSHASKLYVNDFHLSPISDNIPFIYKIDDTLIYKTHQDNVKAYYRSNKGNFYKEGLTAGFTHNWPLINNDDKHLTVYSNIYDMGCRRSKHFNAYKKQFEFLCPVWLEQLNGTLSFKINVKNTHSNTILASNTLSLSLNGQEFHDKFVNYFNNYIKFIGVDTGDDKLLNIQFRNNIANIHGLNVNTGMIQTKPLNNIISNITSRERPLIETDNLLIQSFANNNMICKQLFNFNLCFNIPDILSGGITNIMLGEDVIVSVDVFIDGKQIDKKDFYTNYEYIDKKVWSDAGLTLSENVLSYLHDNECIDLINKNKFCQSICHWSLTENTDYIFNVYEGFSGLYVSKDDNGDQIIYENEHQYGEALNTYIKKSDKSQNTNGWTNTIEIRTWNEFYKYLSNTITHKTDGTYIYDNNFISNIKYEYIPKFESYTFYEQKGIYVLKLLVTNKLLSMITNSIQYTNINGKSLIFTYKDDLLLFISNDENDFSYGQFYDSLHAFVNSDDIYAYSYNEQSIKYLSELYKMMHSRVEPSIIIFNNSLSFNNTVSPTIETTEIEYYKDDTVYNYVIRYDGHIKPTFTDKPEYLYYKDYASSKLSSSSYAIYGKNGQEPLFPSIGFCAIKKIPNWTFDELPKVYVTEYDEPVDIYEQTYEYSWFNNNRCIILNDVIKFTYVCTPQEDGTYKLIDDIIYEVIGSYYDIDDNGLVSYIKNQYVYDNDWQYYSNTNVDDYIYNITLKLK